MAYMIPKGFARLDLGDMRRVAGATGFDIREHARRKRSCGPGCDYLVHDKRYYGLLLLRHVEQMLLDRPEDVPPDVRNWVIDARRAVSEYEAIELALLPPIRTKG